MRDLVAPYALGSVTEEERAALLAHLPDCAECRAELADFERVAGLLPLAVADAAPPAALRDRVLRDARQVRPIGSARPAGWRLTGPRLAAAASIAVALATGLWAWLATTQVRALHGALATARADLAARESTVTALLGQRVHVVSLAAEGQPPALRVFWNHDRNEFVVTAFALPPAAEGRTYQLWAIADGRLPVSMGTFDTDAAGRATAVLPVDPAVTALGLIRLCALTAEPEGGSPQPTEAPRLVGAWTHTD
jgi:anti-sigma-K factor RskA